MLTIINKMRAYPSIFFRSKLTNASIKNPTISIHGKGTFIPGPPAKPEAKNVKVAQMHDIQRYKIYMIYTALHYYLEPFGFGGGGGQSGPGHCPLAFAFAWPAA